MNLYTPLWAAFLAAISLTSLGCSSASDDRLRAEEPAADGQQLRVQEARAIVQLNEIRLFNVQARAKQEDLKWANVQETYEQTRKAHGEGAIPARTFREAKEQYDWWVLQDNVQDLQEAHAELEIAKIRLRMVESGIQVYRGTKP